VAGPIRADLASEGFRVLDGEGKPLVDFWPRKQIPAKAIPAGAQGAVLLPFLAEGELIGAAKYHQEAGDYRDQSIAPTVYTLRYLLNPINGDHLGVSTYRDFLLLVPAAKDASLELLARPALEKRSAEAAGTSHPAVLSLLPTPPEPPPPGMARDEAKDLWIAVIPLRLSIEGKPEPVSFTLAVVVEGAAAQ
jgi:hypothetical protein